MEHTDHVRENTSDQVNARLDRAMDQRVRRYAGRPGTEIRDRITELDREWDIERWLEANASALAFTGLVLGLARDRRWLWLPGFVLPFLFLHAVQGWCPPVPLLRRLGVRTRKEIDREVYALKAARGDFRESALVPPAESSLRDAKA